MVSLSDILFLTTRTRLITLFTLIQVISDNLMAAYTINKAEAYWQDQIEVEL